MKLPIQSIPQPIPRPAGMDDALPTPAQTIEAAMHTLQDVIGLLQDTQPEMGVDDRSIALLRYRVIKDVMQTLWDEACFARSATVESVVRTRAETCNQALLHHALGGLAAGERSSHRLSARERASYVLIGAHSALWALRWTLLDYRKPSSDLIFAIAEVSAFAYLAESADADNPSLQEALRVLARVFILAVSDTYALTPSELHGLSAYLDTLDAVGRPQVEPRCHGPAALLLPLADSIKLEFSFERSAPLLHLPLGALIDTLETRRELHAKAESMRLHLIKRLGAPVIRSEVRQAFASGRLAVGFFAILEAERRWLTQAEQDPVSGTWPCSVSDASDSGVRVRTRKSSLRVLPGQLVALELGPPPQKGLGLVRWVRRAGGGLLDIGVEYLHDCFSVEIMRSQDSAWPNTGLRVQQGIVAGLESGRTTDQIHVFISHVSNQEDTPPIPQAISLVDYDLAFTFAAPPQIFNGWTRLTYRCAGTQTRAEQHA